MPDLYGEMLARTLNRGAPPGHSAAYITPQEGRQLRASGGGVAPGGGQYMANGIPSFQEAGFDDPGISNPTGPTGGLGSAGHEMGGTGWSSPAERGMAAAEHAQRQAGTEGLAHSLDDMFAAPSITGLEDAISQAATQAAEEQAYGYAVGEEPPGTFIGNTPPSYGNIPSSQRNTSMEGYRNNPENFDDYGNITEIGVQNARNDISDDGLGFFSPGYMAIEEGMSFADLAAINSVTEEGGYSVNATNPTAHDLRVSFLNARYNPQFANAVYGIGGLVSPTFMMGVNMINRRSPHAQYEGYRSPGFGPMLGDALRSMGFEDVVDAVGNLGSTIGEELSGITDPITGAIGRAGTAIGDEISGALSPVTNFFGGLPAPEQGPSVPQDGGNQEIAFVPNIAPLNEVAARGEQTVPAQEYYIPPEEIRRRIAANVLAGRQRVGLA
tara:strand:- start:1508 stop:2827 length:1320 start_codon:yes stop_codon:yes gene_type:complete